MKRRAFVAGLSSSLLWRAVSQAQEQQGEFVVGWLHSASPSGGYAAAADAFASALDASGFKPGRNLRIEYRWAEDDFGRLGTFAAELVDRNVSVIFAGGGDVTAIAAKSATSKIPIVFAIGADPVKTGLVKSLSQPGQNITGATFLLVELRPKLVQLVRELLPVARSVAILLNPHRPNAGAVEAEMAAVTSALNLQPRFLRAGNQEETDQLLSSLSSERSDAVLILSDPVFLNHTDHIVSFIERLGIPTVYPTKGFVLAGGLLSYGVDFTPAYRAAGHYVARILKGESPATLPIQQAAKVEMIVNLKRAKALHVSVPEMLLARADEVIE